ncbi:hypothetical protein [Bizionia myxarmorum]|nr:hypothetical protein [Bizionia myxarmorum]
MREPRQIEQTQKDFNNLTEIQKAIVNLRAISQFKLPKQNRVKPEDLLK